MTIVFAPISCVAFVITILHIKFIGLPVEKLSEKE